MAAKGRRVTFHGAFASKADAVARERQVHGFIRPMLVAGQRRYAVLTRNPRTDWSWPAGMKTFATLVAARAHARTIRGSEGAFVGRLTNGRYGVCSFDQARARGWV